MNEVQVREHATAFVEEIRNIVIEGEFESRWKLIETYHEVGKRLREEWGNQIDNDAVQGLAVAIDRKPRTLRYALKLYDTFPQLDMIPDGKNASWNKLINNHLTDKQQVKKHQCQIDYKKIDMVIENLHNVLDDEIMVKRAKAVIYPELEKVYKQIQLEKQRGDIAIGEKKKLKEELTEKNARIKELEARLKLNKESVKETIKPVRTTFIQVYREQYKDIKGVPVGSITPAEISQIDNIIKFRGVDSWCTADSFKEVFQILKDADGNVSLNWHEQNKIINDLKSHLTPANIYVKFNSVMALKEKIKPAEPKKHLYLDKLMRDEEIEIPEPKGEF